MARINEVVVSDVLSSSANEDECVTKRSVVAVSKFPTSTSEMHTIVFKAINSKDKLQYSWIRNSERCYVQKWHWVKSQQIAPPYFDVGSLILRHIFLRCLTLYLTVFF